MPGAVGDLDALGIDLPGRPHGRDPLRRRAPGRSMRRSGRARAAGYAAPRCTRPSSEAVALRRRAGRAAHRADRGPGRPTGSSWTASRRGTCSRPTASTHPCAGWPGLDAGPASGPAPLRAAPALRDRTLDAVRRGALVAASGGVRDAGRPTTASVWRSWSTAAATTTTCWPRFPVLRERLAGVAGDAGAGGRPATAAVSPPGGRPGAAGGRRIRLRRRADG